VGGRVQQACLQRAIAVDSEHALVVAQQAPPRQHLHSLKAHGGKGEAAVGIRQVARGGGCGYANGEQAEACERQGIVPHVPAPRGVNNQWQRRANG